MPHQETTTSSSEQNQQLTTTRVDARRLGLARYYTGRLCKHGHRAERYSSTSVCTECSRRRLRKSTVITREQDRRSRTGEADGFRWIYVYRLENTKDGRYYIGSTEQRLGRRFTEHKVASRNLKRQSPLYRALRSTDQTEWVLKGTAMFPIDAAGDIEFARRYEATRIHDCIGDPLCLNVRREPDPLPIDGVLRLMRAAALMHK